MFLEFQKITSSDPSRRSPIIVNADAILTIDTATVDDTMTGAIYDATRISVIGYPKHQFYTMTPFDVVNAQLNVIDAPTEFNVVYPIARYPLLKTKALFNNTTTETVDYVLNLNYLLFAENTIINDSVTQSQQTVLLL